MTTFTPKLSAYTMTQLNELLEDDEKLSNIVQEMDEVRALCVCAPVCLCLCVSVSPFVVFS